MEKSRLLWPDRPLVDLEGRSVKLETRKAAVLFAYLSLAQGECQRKLPILVSRSHCYPALTEDGKSLRGSATSPAGYYRENDRSLRIDGMDSA